MDTNSRHLLVEYSGCSPAVLNDVALVEAMMQRAAEAANARIVASVFQPFEPQGVTGVVVIEESHLSIHTWPEYGYAAVDYFTCGSGNPDAVHEVVRAALGATECEKMIVERGLAGRPGAPAKGMRLGGHTTERPRSTDGRPDVRQAATRSDAPLS